MAQERISVGNEESLQRRIGIGLGLVGLGHRLGLLVLDPVSFSGSIRIENPRASRQKNSREWHATQPTREQGVVKYPDGAAEIRLAHKDRRHEAHADIPLNGTATT
jgi:hypothetical protein